MITREHIKKLTTLLENTTGKDIDDLEGFPEAEEFWENIDEDHFKEEMGNIPLTPENILKYYEKNPDILEIILDDLYEDYSYHNWNVDAWRNS